MFVKSYLVFQSNEGSAKISILERFEHAGPHGEGEVDVVPEDVVEETGHVTEGHEDQAFRDVEQHPGESVNNSTHLEKVHWKAWETSFLSDFECSIYEIINGQLNV